MHHSALAIVLAGLAAAAAAPAQANSIATFVSGTGVDSGACTAAAPCRTLQFAFERTKFYGVITIVTSGSFAPVSINRPVSIVADGVTALIQSAVACGGVTAAVCIDGASEVTLRGLTIDLQQTTLSTQAGIRFNFGGALHVQNCLIRAAGGSGIDFEPTSPASKLFVSNTTLTDNQGRGINVDGFNGGNLGYYAATFDHVRAENNAAGLVFSSALNGVVTNSVSAGNGVGVGVGSISGAMNLTMDRTTIATNSSTGFEFFAGPDAVVRIGDSTIAGNTTGLQPFPSDQILSFGNNKLISNGTDGAFTGTIAPQ
jgi:hypothetical protein